MDSQGKIVLLIEWKVLGAKEIWEIYLGILGSILIPDFYLESKHVSTNL